ncbi:hypothetical protein QBC38DRAFT_179070 [Podospora fimiseda]|uniref:Uncharacterized protein n=1 Tax=Podospora fimiseda TaxID=252190 RepID=A0AAN7BZW0_9PEZI|nr:hypothetical protein QBC38DRAFT_179070 [Podospora fimiseda]
MRIQQKRTITKNQEPPVAGDSDSKKKKKTREYVCLDNGVWSGVLVDLGFVGRGFVVQKKDGGGRSVCWLLVAGCGAWLVSQQRKRQRHARRKAVLKENLGTLLLLEPWDRGTVWEKKAIAPPN